MSLFGMAGMVIDPTTLPARQLAQQVRNRRPDLLELEEQCGHLGGGCRQAQAPVNLRQYETDSDSGTASDTDSGTDDDGDYDTDSSEEQDIQQATQVSDSDSDYESDDDAPEYITKATYDARVRDMYKGGPLPRTPDIPIGSQRPYSVDGDTTWFNTWQQTPEEDSRVFTGYYTDPNTGVKYRTYQDALPPPNRADGWVHDDDLKKTHPRLVALSGWVDPNRPDVAKKEREAGLPGIADGASFAGQQLLSTGDRNESRYRVARDIFMHRHGEQPGDRMPVMDKYPNGYVGYQQAYRPTPWMGVTYRGDDTRWVTPASAQTPSGKQLQTVQPTVLLNQNPSRQKPSRIAPLDLGVEWQSRTSCV